MTQMNLDEDLTLLRHAPWGRDGAVNTVPALMADGTAG
jgi:hypothetical protein